MNGNSLPWKYVVLAIFFFVAFLLSYYSYHSTPSFDYVGNLQHYSKYNYNSDKYEIAIVADMDTESRLLNKSGTFRSSFIIGDLTRLPNSTYTVKWREPIELLGEYNEGGRGLELSELIHFNGMLLTCDDRTGIIYEINLANYELFPRYILPTGDGNKSKGFKCEWITVKNKELYVGSTGKEWTNKQGKLISYDTQWVKVLNYEGSIRSLDWRDNYNSLVDTLNLKNNDGYIVHEAVNWNPFTNEWMFLPRRVSNEKYDADTESNKGSNHLFIANEDFTKVSYKLVGDKNIEQGFSSFKFVPFRPNEIIALKTVEIEGDRIESYITVIDIETNTYLMKETLIEKNKYEGIEFL